MIANGKFALFSMFIGLAAAQTGPSAAAHWTGSITAPQGEIGITVDLARNAAGVWIGSFSMPAQGAADVPLHTISVDGTAVKFSYDSIGASPHVVGTMASDGSAITGSFNLGNFAAALALKREGPANVKTPPASTALSKEFEGRWAGTVAAQQTQLQVTLTLARGEGGIAEGSLVSVDPSGQPLNLPLTAIVQTGKQLRMEVRAVSGVLELTLDEAAGTLQGSWTERTNAPIPLTLRRAGQ